MRSSEQFLTQHSKFNIAKGNHSTFKIYFVPHRSIALR